MVPEIHMPNSSVTCLLSLHYILLTLPVSAIMHNYTAHLFKDLSVNLGAVLILCWTGWIQIRKMEEEKLMRFLRILLDQKRHLKQPGRMVCDEGWAEET